MAEHGKNLLLKAGDGGDPETFTTIAGLRTKTLSLNRETIDVTHSESAELARELLTGGGVKTAEFSGSGLADTGADKQTLISRFTSGSIDNYEVTVPGIGVFVGPFQIASMEFGGEHAGEATFEASFQSAGVWTFTAQGA